MDHNNLPYSSEKSNPPGLDVEIAREIARRLEARLDIRWIDTLEAGLLSPLLAPDSPIDFVAGVPIEFRAVEESGPVGEEVLYSLPYASARYVLVTKKAASEISNFEDVKSKEIAAEAGSVAAIDLSRAGYRVKDFGSQEKILSALAAGEAEYGVLWPNAGWMIDQNTSLRDALRIQSVRCPVAGLAWNIALAVARPKRELLPQLDGVIVTLRKENWFKRIFEKYRMPHFEPFDPQGKTEP